MLSRATNGRVVPAKAGTHGSRRSSGSQLALGCRGACAGMTRGAFAGTTGPALAWPPMAASLPKVSVALCVYNGARWLPAQLDSVLAQEGVEVEVVALDERSTENSLEVLRDYA